jgi:ABC-type uncharacterized transport system YnjBCD ATPase subunit/GNAT superfamily N-acetyltransferase
MRKGKKEFRKYLQGTYDLKPSSAVVEACTLRTVPANGSFHIGVIQGPSGSGKSTTLAKFQPQMRTKYRWQADLPLMEQLGKTPKEAEAMLFAVALNNIPDWTQSYDRLSTGQKYRADLARTLSKHKPGAFLVMDEFGSTLDENSAHAISHRLQRYARRNNISVVLATNRASLFPYLRPDWVLNTQDCTYSVQPFRNWPRPKLKLVFTYVEGEERQQLWDIFRKYHYLNHKLVGHAKVFRVTCNGQLCAFQASKRHFNPVNMVHAHRTVVLPEFQGLGIGTVIHDTVGAYVASQTRWWQHASTPRPRTSRKPRKPPRKAGWLKQRGVFSVVTSHTKLAGAHAADTAHWETKYLATPHHPNPKVFRTEKRIMNAFHYHGPPMSTKLCNIFDAKVTCPSVTFSRTITVR